MKPADFDLLVAEIDRCYKQKGSNEVHMALVRRCMAYMDANHQGRHWFCDEYTYPITSYCLMLFSFTLLKWLGRYKPIMQESLLLCRKCVSRFSVAMDHWKLDYSPLMGITSKMFGAFDKVITDWQLAPIKETLRAHNFTTSPSKEVVHCIFACLCRPVILRNDKEIKDIFNKIFTQMIKESLLDDFAPHDIIGGLVYILFEGTPEQRYWVELIVKKTPKFTMDTITPCFASEFSVHLYRIQDSKYYNDTAAIRFWTNTRIFLDLADNDVFVKALNAPGDIESMREYLGIHFYPLIRVFFNNLMAFLKEPLPVLLLLLDKFLDRFGSSFWDLTAPFIFANVLDIASHPEFSLLLVKLPREKDPLYDWTFDDITLWLPKFLQLLNQSQQQTSCLRLATFFIKLAKTINPEDDKYSMLNGLAFDMLLEAFQVPRELLASKKDALYIDLLQKTLLRSILENDAELLVTLALHNMASCIELISRALQYDLMLLGHNSTVLLANGEPTSYDAYPLLWQTLSNKPIYSHEKLTSEILKLLWNTVLAVKFAPRKDELPKKLADARKQHNANVTLIFNVLALVLEKISLGEPAVLKQIFQLEQGLVTIWSCIFSPLISQAASDILYQVFDIGLGGRFEAIQGLLGTHLGVTVAAVHKNLATLTQMRAFEPCPKAIRLLMDIVKGLFDPLSGVVTKEVYQDNTVLLQQLWRQCWAFLVMVYEKTLHWAAQFHLEDLIEFARDTLDLSHLLVDSFRILLNSIDDKNTELALLQNVMDAFKAVIVWLRLGETSLLNSCLDLVFKGLDLVQTFGVTVDAEFAEWFTRFGAKSKKFNNKLTENQRLQIVSKARELDNDMVERILLEQVKKVEKSQSPSELANYTYQTHAKPAKQQTLSRFGVITHEAPVAPPPPKDIKALSLDAIRNQLKSARTGPVPAAPPALAPAPARPAGFNSKRAPAVGRSLNGLKKKHQDLDSSGGEEEESADFSDLFVDKKKKAKITEVDINGKVLTRPSRDSKVLEARREEERMRQRLNVSLKPLYTNILKWNYNSTDEFPTKDREVYQPIKSSYADYKEYIKVTEPLLMLECWQGIQSAKQTVEEVPFEMLIGSRTSVDGFFDVYASCKKAIFQERKIGDSDLLVIGHTDPSLYNGPKDLARYLKSPSTNTCLAKIREIKSANAEFCDVTLRVYPGGSMMGVLTPKLNVVCMKVMQMITIEREYSSLKGLQYYDLSDSILSATPNKPVDLSADESSDVMLLYQVNKSQARAIAGTFKNEGFSLIQGPPGTGKTKTILGVVGYSLSQQMAKNAITVPNETGTVPAAPQSAKILICAPSNAAVDELVVRLRDGVRNYKGEIMPLKVIRLGRSDAVNAAVRDLTLEELVDKELQTKAVDVATDPNLRSEHSKCISERDSLREQMKDPSLNANALMELESKLRDVNKKRNELAKKLDDQRERVSIAYRTREIDRRNLQAKILNGAQVICSTLSGSAHDFLQKLSLKFDQVIIDEACQCVELSAIIPLRYGCKKCVMVGDPNQLPPTVLSQAAASYNYEQSLFVRMQKNNPQSVYLLDVQYRMHPEISQFPSKEFYNSRLLDGEGMKEKNERWWHSKFPLTPYRFFDIVSKHERNDLTRSLFNTGEARVALELVEKVMEMLPPSDFAGRVGIISPYKEQIRTLKDVFARKYGRGIWLEIDFNTVDGFQGQEKEIIIMSCVRASETGNVGFLSDIRRMNVALTRARTSLWILGNKDSLKRNKVWDRLLTDAENRGDVTKAYPGFLKTMTQGSIPLENVSQASQASHKVPQAQGSRKQTVPQEMATSTPSSNSSTPPGPPPVSTLPKRPFQPEDQNEEPNRKKHYKTDGPKAVKSLVFLPQATSSGVITSKANHKKKPYIANSKKDKSGEKMESNPNGQNRSVSGHGASYSNHAYDQRGNQYNQGNNTGSVIQSNQGSGRGDGRHPSPQPGQPSSSGILPQRKKPGSGMFIPRQQRRS